MTRFPEWLRRKRAAADSAPQEATQRQADTFEEVDTPETVYLLKAVRMGLSNEALIETAKDSHIILRIKTKLLTPLRKQYTIYDSTGNEVFATKQDHTAVFPRHTIVKHDAPVVKVGQARIIPLEYFIEVGSAQRAVVHVGGAEKTCPLKAGDTVAAEITRTGWNWLVTIAAQRDRLLILAGLAVIYKDTMTSI